MFRKALFSLGIAAALVAFACPTVASAQEEKTPIENFKDYSLTGWIMGYYGYVYCDYARYIAVANGYDDNDTQGSFYYAQQYALYSYIYGYYGWEYEYAEWILQAADLARASRNYEKGVYDYINENYYNTYRRQLQPIMDAMLYGYLFEEYADVYYTYAYSFVAPPEDEEGDGEGEEDGEGDGEGDAAE